MKQRKNNSGFSLVETIIALVVLLVGILATMSALSFGIFSIQESEKRSVSKEIARSTMETIFSMRDLNLFNPQTGGAVYNWDAIQIRNSGNQGIFLEGWSPVRENPGRDGIFGTADDACAGSSACVVNGIRNDSPVMGGFERKIEIYDINENGAVRKRRITVRVRYIVGQLEREVVESTIIAHFPVN